MTVKGQGHSDEYHPSVDSSQSQQSWSRITMEQSQKEGFSEKLWTVNF